MVRNLKTMSENKDDFLNFGTFNILHRFKCYDSFKSNCLNLKNFLTQKYTLSKFGSKNLFLY